MDYELILCKCWFSTAKVVIAYPTLVPVVLEMFESLKVPEEEARKRIIIAGWGLQDKGPSGFIQMEDLLGRGNIRIPERFDGHMSHETTLLCYSSGTTGKPKGVEVRIRPELIEGAAC